MAYSFVASVMVYRLDERFIVVQWSEKIKLPAGETVASPRELGRPMSDAFNGVSVPPHTIKSHHELGNDRSLAVQTKHRAGSPEWRRSNILPGTGAAGAFYAESESYSKPHTSLEPESEALNIFPVSYPFQGCGTGVGTVLLRPVSKSEPTGGVTQSGNGTAVE